LLTISTHPELPQNYNTTNNTKFLTAIIVALNSLFLSSCQSSFSQVKHLQTVQQVIIGARKETNLLPTKIKHIIVFGWATI